MMQINNVNSSIDDNCGIHGNLKSLLTKYNTSIFSSKIRKLKNYKVMLHLNIGVPYVAQKESRIHSASLKNLIAN